MSIIDQIVTLLPQEFDEGIYRELHPDLRQMTDAQLRAHYERYGRIEGRRCHALIDRRAFVALVPPDVDALEIGPFYKPLLSGERVRYFDVLDRAMLVERATRSGISIENIPHIHFVAPNGDLRVVDDTFDVVLSSHVIEHQPDLIAHLRNVERLLRPGGLYFLLVPDKGFCFDHFIAPSTLAQILEAHHNRPQTHGLRSKIEHAALTTHNDPKRHWKGDHGRTRDVIEKTRRTVAAHLEAPNAYVDVHAWYFAPAVFRELLSALRELGYIGFDIARLYPTLKDRNEFWAILRANGKTLNEP